MKFASFLSTYAKRTVRDRMFFIIMLLFPMLLIWLLGNAFAGIMDDGGSGGGMSKASIIYSAAGDSALADTFEQYLVQSENEYFIIEEAKSRDDALESIERNSRDAFVEISSDVITVHKNSSFNFNSSLAELIIRAFVDEYNLIYEIASVSPQSMAEMPDDTRETFTEEISFDKERTPGSMDYYGVTISTMFIFYGMIFLGTYFAGNRVNKTEDRIKASPASITSYQWGTALGSMALLSLQAFIVVLAGILVFNVYWGDALLVGAVVILAEILMVSAVGTLVGILIKNENMIAGISQVVIPAIVFLGDGYVQIGGGEAMLAVKKISPMYWINHGIFDAVYLNDYNNALISVMISVGIALACTAVVMIMNRKRRLWNA